MKFLKVEQSETIFELREPAHCRCWNLRGWSALKFELQKFAVVVSIFETHMEVALLMFLESSLTSSTFLFADLFMYLNRVSLVK